MNLLGIIKFNSLVGLILFFASCGPDISELPPGLTDDFLQEAPVASASTDSSVIIPTPAQKFDIMTKYAPLVYLGDKEFYPSSVEWAMNYMDRVKYGNEWWLTTKQKLNKPTDILPFFHGNSNLKDVPAYPFWVSKAGGRVDIVYFFYYPYNLGKQITPDLPVIGTIFKAANTLKVKIPDGLVLNTYIGNHVSDWEKITVEIDGFMIINGVLVPNIIAVVYEAHAGLTETIPWPRVRKYDGTHAIVYAAAGSHGNWKEAGKHKYGPQGLQDLGITVDHTSEAVAWKTWENLQAFDFNNKRGLSPNTQWPSWMSLDRSIFGSIYRWGNKKAGCVIDDLLDMLNGLIQAINDINPTCIPGVFTSTCIDKIGKVNECELNDGPEGPPFKDEYWRGACPLKDKYYMFKQQYPTYLSTGADTIVSPEEMPLNYDFQKYRMITSSSDGAVSFKALTNNNFLTVRGGGVRIDASSTDNRAETTKFKIIKNDNDTISLKTFNNKFVGVSADGTKIVAEAPYISATTQLKLINNPDKTVSVELPLPRIIAFRDTVLGARRFPPSELTSFSIEPVGSGVALKSLVNNKYVRLRGDGRLYADSKTVTREATFTKIDHSDGTVSLQAWNGLYVSIMPHVGVNMKVIGPNETMRMTEVPCPY